MAAELKALILCDFAQVREGLLFVQSGGLTRLVTTRFPAKFPCHLAALVYVPPGEADATHELVMKIKAASTATVIATIRVAVHERPAATGLAPGEGRQVPVVAPLGAVTFPEEGEYDLHADIDGEFATDLSFRVVAATRAS